MRKKRMPFTGGEGKMFEKKDKFRIRMVLDDFEFEFFEGSLKEMFKVIKQWKKLKPQLQGVAQSQMQSQPQPQLHFQQFQPPQSRFPSQPQPRFQQQQYQDQYDYRGYDEGYEDSSQPMVQPVALPRPPMPPQHQPIPQQQFQPQPQPQQFQQPQNFGMGVEQQQQPVHMRVPQQPVPKVKRRVEEVPKEIPPLVPIIPPKGRTVVRVR